MMKDSSGHSSNRIREKCRLVPLNALVLLASVRRKRCKSQAASTNTWLQYSTNASKATWYLATCRTSCTDQSMSRSKIADNFDNGQREAYLWKIGMSAHTVASQAYNIWLENAWGIPKARQGKLASRLHDITRPMQSTNTKVLSWMQQAANPRARMQCRQDSINVVCPEVGLVILEPNGIEFNLVHKPSCFLPNQASLSRICKKYLLQSRSSRVLAGPRLIHFRAASSGNLISSKTCSALPESLFPSLFTSFRSSVGSLPRWTAWAWLGYTLALEDHIACESARWCRCQCLLGTAILRYVWEFQGRFAITRVGSLRSSCWPAAGWDCLGQFILEIDPTKKLTTVSTWRWDPCLPTVDYGTCRHMSHTKTYLYRGSTILARIACKCYFGPYYDFVGPTWQSKHQRSAFPFLLIFLRDFSYLIPAFCIWNLLALLYCLVCKLLDQRPGKWCMVQVWCTLHLLFICVPRNAVKWFRSASPRLKNLFISRLFQTILKFKMHLRDSLQPSCEFRDRGTWPYCIPSFMDSWDMYGQSAWVILSPSRCSWIIGTTWLSPFLGLCACALV